MKLYMYHVHPMSYLTFCRICLVSIFHRIMSVCTIHIHPLGLRTNSEGLTLGLKPIMQFCFSIDMEISSTLFY